MTATGVNAAGIIGTNKGSSAIFSITNCYNTGDITGTSESAAISGWVGSGATIQNCYNIGTITGYNYRNDFYRGSATALNCYSTSTTQVTRVSDEDVTSGKLCYRLKSGVTMEPIWYQTLGEDAYPIFDNSHLVVLKSDDDTYYNVSNLAGDVNSNNVLDEEDALWIAAYLTGNEPDGFEVKVDADNGVGTQCCGSLLQFLERLFLGFDEHVFVGSGTTSEEVVDGSHEIFHYVGTDDDFAGDDAIISLDVVTLDGRGGC